MKTNRVARVAIVQVGQALCSTCPTCRENCEISFEISWDSPVPVKCSICGQDARFAIEEIDDEDN